MDRTERFYRIDQLLNERTVVPAAVFLDELGISPATFKRDLEYLRDRLHAPIIWDRDAGGYRFEQAGVGSKYELPGLWFSAAEIHALITMQQLLTSLDHGLLTPHIEPLLARLRMLLDREDIPPNAIEKRIRIPRQQARSYEPEHFPPIATAVFQRKRLQIDHYSKGRNETLRREVSPQRLNYYRDNWYLDAWCHLRNEVRSFALDAISNVKLLDEKAKEVAEKDLRAVLDVGYGIFSGKSLQWAELVFSSERARWVSKEQWHPEQQGTMAADGSYHLKLPYSDPRELCMEILKHVPEVQVLAPPALRKQVKELLRQGLERL